MTNLDVFGNPINKDYDNDCHDDPEGSLSNQDPEEARNLELIVLYGREKTGFSTNPNLEERPTSIVINGEKIVCTAQGGECRRYGEFYSPGLRDTGSWRTPIISAKCENSCPYKYLVCDGHNHTDEEDVFIFTPFPQYNKFRGEFTTYCKDLDRIKI